MDHLDLPARVASPPINESGVVVAGGTSGVGLATGIQFGLAGAPRVVLMGRNEDRGRAAVESAQAKSPVTEFTFIRADANDPGSATAAAAAAKDVLGRIDVLCNSTVAPYQPTLFHQTTTEDIPRMFLEQAVGPLVMTSAVVPYLRDQGSGSVICIASDAAKVPTPGETIIGASMSAIVTFTRTLALEAKRYGIRVNSITPSLIAETGSFDRAMNQEFSKKIFTKITSQAHLGMTGPDDLAHLAVFLSSPEASLITGQVISVNGGISVA
ncbi:2-hydroxycyclohexane-1-carbonyl-CoA dehydrogenase [Citricoccus zhacaiensis]|uniref:2-hydroxycyclohexane-1-carbonyl-CoA dehydrogenase n=1 Tax=Citricoccus zhacaiensis TaxID=489142 RepID=A0ABQ2LY85_9MICC|nr:SDR family oxidoreductase [Citricoccus zhacaiensis]GGO43668.1 2-hydroxycyclohexane-1-carbonyl-CoA dehydrogenase [Citricoccus zhacaiensis]